MGAPRHRFVSIPAGAFTKGDGGRYPEEGPPVTVEVAAFLLDSHPVTNSQFGRFVVATGYVTEAELARPAVSAVFRRPLGPVDIAQSDRWWDEVPGASWHRRFGWGSDLTGIGDHPVVHVTLADAQATGTITNDDIAPTGLPVAWTNAAGVTVAGNSLTKTATAGWGNAGAVSSQALTSPPPPTSRRPST